jgi:hypothetical protein
MVDSWDIFYIPTDIERQISLILLFYIKNHKIKKMEPYGPTLAL